ncbi:hypothetical protein [Permianibacter aggregans]|uniref:Uncharacterized protein n=1 Tax=Permianibacter aggregans TaxID=1510150 RepID=A0A4V3D7F9_9GAMM|nr:hypothetical protein [Permianibacter aggregans]QGX40167.1 hypothetical protein E2H98_10990 [Permianibacter aggregans]TDQ47417.1 hypothetical protein EV696_1109 [Permianibacter aggregans]
MTPIFMGQVMAHMLKTRKLDSTASKRKSRVDEHSFALALRDASLDERAELEALFRGFGYDLVHFTDFNTQGIAPGGHVFLLLRRLDEVNELFSESWIDEYMQLRGNSVTERRIWFVQIWFVLFSLFYTKRNRVITEVSRYVETNFTRMELARSVHEYINELVRKLGPDSLDDDVVYKCLTSETGKQVEQYCDRFLDLMVDGGLLDRLGEDRYRQSLLSSAEMRNNHLQGLEPWLSTIGAMDSNPLESGRILLVRPDERAEQQES